MTQRKKAVQKVTDTGFPVDANGFDSYEGAGLENVTSDDMLVPRLSILQSLSPQVLKSKPEYIEGAQVSDILDTGTGDTWSTDQQPVIFLPCYYRKDYLEWAPRSSGGGLVALHDDASILELCTKDEKASQVLDNGNLIQETAQFFGLNLSAHGRHCFIPMARTQLKRARKWVTLATSERLARPDGSTFTPPLFYRAYQLAAVEESNNEGTWYSWLINRHVALPEMEGWEDIMTIATKFRDDLIKGNKKADETAFDEAKTAASDAAM